MKGPEKNIAVVGCGYWGKNLVRNFAKLGALHTICDIDAVKLKDLLPRDTRNPLISLF